MFRKSLVLEIKKKHKPAKRLWPQDNNSNKQQQQQAFTLQQKKISYQSKISKKSYSE